MGNRQKYLFSKFLSPKLLLQISLGVFLSGLLAGYSPSPTTFPPLKLKTVHAQEVSLVATPTPIEFKLPHTGYISTYFSSYHPGIDIAVGLGLPVHASAAGTVTSSGYNFFGLGLTVEITHQYGYKTIYAHLGKTYVKTGQTVESEDSIGEVGLTGHTSGPHTHFELYKEGKAIDPTTVLPNLPNIYTAWPNSNSNASISAKISN